MNIEMATVIIGLSVMFICLVKEVFRPDFIVFCALAMFLLLGLVTPSEALQGFSNEGMLTVALLFVVAGAVQQSDFVSRLIHKLLGRTNRISFLLVRMMFPVAGLSAFLNNTPIVVMLTPMIRKWCENHHIAPSKLLLPLSYAAIFGGTITLIGTSTNLLVHGLMLELGMVGFSMFQLAIIALPASIISIFYMSTVGHRLLPSRKTLEHTFAENAKEYLAEAVVEPDFPHIGKTIEEAGLRNLEGLFLIEIIRGNERIYPVTSYQCIKESDILIFTGLISTIIEIQNIKGLSLGTGSDLSMNDLENGQYRLIEAVISHQSSLNYKTVKENQFRSKFDAAVIAVHRNQERIRSKIGKISLKPGDSVLLLAGNDFIKRWSPTNDFYLISNFEHSSSNQGKKSNWSVIVLIMMIGLATLGILTIFKAALISVITLVITRLITLEQAKKYVHFNVLLLIASAIGIGAVIEKSGTATYLATFLIEYTQVAGVLGVLAVTYLLTNLFTEMITNNAAVVFMFPIALALANQLSIDPVAFFIVITIAASASFVTPIGYQTNLIVYGPGGYRFSDYMKVGFPISVVYFILTVSVVYHIYV